MDWTATIAIAEIIGVIAVVISLIYVGFQVRQNTIQLKQDNLRVDVRGTLDTNWYYHRDPAAFEVMRKGCASFNNLSPLEKAHFHSIVVDLSFFLEMVTSNYRVGLMDKAAVDINERFFLGVLVTPGGSEWWEFARQSEPMPKEAIDYLQSRLDDPNLEIVPLTELQPWLATDNRQAEV